MAAGRTSAEAAFPSEKTDEFRWWNVLWRLLLPSQGNRHIPTPAGFILIMVSVGLLGAAYSTANNILFLALSLLFSTFILSGILSLANFRRVRYQLKVPDHLRAKEIAPILLDVRNHKRWLPSYSIWFNFRASDGGSERIFLQRRLEPNGRQAIEWHYTPSRRGWLRIEIDGAESQFPFGFIKKCVGHTERARALALPARVDYQFRIPSGRHSPLPGSNRLRRGSGAELVNIRQYQSGDPQRLVHWKASARTKRLMIRQMAEENREGLRLHLSSAGEAWQEAWRLDLLCSFAASLAEDLFKEGRLLEVSINEQPAQPIRRMHDLQLFLEQLAVLEADKKEAERKAGSPNLITFEAGTENDVIANIGGTPAGAAYRN